MIAVETGARRGADDKMAVGSRLADRLITLRVAENVPPVRGHGAGPETARARATDNGQLARAEIFHDPRNGADIAGAARANKNDAQVIQHKAIGNGVIEREA